MLKIYRPLHQSNRMGHEGDIENARKIYLDKANRNLIHLLRNRFSWMNNFIQEDSVGLELGAGIGASRDYIDCKSLILSDYLDSPWLDIGNVDALSTGFKSEEFDFVIASNMIHHLAHPSIFFNECSRILKPEGLLIIQEIHTSFFMKVVLKLMRHEGFNETINVFDSSFPCNDIDDPWSANCSIPKLLFQSHKKFEFHFPIWKVKHDKKVEFFQFLNSGGVVAKTLHIPLSGKLLALQDQVDRLLCTFSPKLFALQRQIVLQKKSN
jgi:SAM-dependent methyltransferase